MKRQPYQPPLLTKHSTGSNSALAAKAASECALLLAMAPGSLPDTRLTITKAGTNVVVSWPATSANCVLEWNTALTAGWTAVQAISKTNEQWVSVTLPLNEAQRFFRLKELAAEKAPLADKDPNEKDPNEKTPGEKDPFYVHLLSVPSGCAGDRNPPGACTIAAHWLVHQFLETLPILVCNRPSAMATNYSKTWQQQVIAAHGFAVPRTLTTNVADEARQFYEDCRRRVIYKSLSARRSIVKRLGPADLDRLKSVESCPTQFQEWVPGADVRVHVIGRRVFSTEIETGAIDYRYSGRDGLPRSMRATELPNDVEARCLELVAALGLVSAGVDLRRSLGGQFYCFEVNPTPGFMFYQQYTHQRIGDALADLLQRPT